MIYEKKTYGSYIYRSIIRNGRCMEYFIHDNGFLFTCRTLHYGVYVLL